MGEHVWFKTYFWKELCTIECRKLVDAKQREWSPRIVESSLQGPFKPVICAARQGSVSLDISDGLIDNIQLKKLTPAEREKSVQDKLCLHFR